MGPGVGDFSVGRDFAAKIRWSEDEDAGTVAFEQIAGHAATAGVAHGDPVVVAVAVVALDGGMGVGGVGDNDAGFVRAVADGLVAAGGGVVENAGAGGHEARDSARCALR